MGPINLKWVTWQPHPFHGEFVICKLRIAIINLCTKFEVNTLAHHEDIKGNAKFNNYICLTPMGRTMLSRAKSTISHWTLSVITRQRASVNSKLLHRLRAVRYYHMCTVSLKLHFVDLLSKYYKQITRMGSQTLPVLPLLDWKWK